MPGKRRPRAAAPMAAEDELLLLQRQALAEEEADKMKREMLTRFLNDKLAKEKRSSTLNLHKLNAQWRAVLRDTKDKELRQDMEILSQTFERVMDCKDSVIESLATDLEEAEEQHAQALRSHLHNVDRLLQLQRCRLTCLEEGYDAQLEALKTEFEAERKTILEQHEQERCYLRDVALAAEQNYAENNHETTLNFQSAWDDIKNKSLQEQQYSRTQLGGKVEVLWEQFQRTTQSYAEATEHQVAFEALKQKVEKSSRDIETHVKKLQKLQDLVTATKGQIAAHLQESEEQNRHMRERKEKLLRQLQELRSEMNQARAKAHGSLARLTAQSGAALKTLARVVEKGQRVLRLAEMCRRLETEEEKVLPFYPSSLAEGEQRDARQVLEEMPTEPLAQVRRQCQGPRHRRGGAEGQDPASGTARLAHGRAGDPLASSLPLAQAMWDYVGLERFWQRFNKAKLEEQALERERVALSQRNRQLRQLLRQYLAGISITQEMLGQPNPLLAVEHKSCVPRDLPQAKGGHASQHPLGRGMPSQTPSTAPPAPAENSPGSDQDTLPSAWEHHRNRDCPEVPLKS
ncbi:dynein regulatory complex subunit 2 isoform X1 [Larus michahellis]|uniref:dynein regulatory complex subunit 2 isoform X1 n=1 Tax=Larus michahellis TaxID=119627 RepID=UPI003D9AB74F